MIAPVQQIVPMQQRHVAAIAALEAANFSAPWDEASIRSELDNPLALWLVAEGAGNGAGNSNQNAAEEAEKSSAKKTGSGAEKAGVLGYVGSQTCFEDADILNVCVAPAARRQGVAEALMLELEKKLLPQGVEQITLEVRASNEPAIRLYEKLGYAQLGVRKGYYEKPREDALILRKELKIER